MGFADEMRSPGSGCLGWMARKIMAGGVKEHVDAVQGLLDVSESMTVVELGPGAGGALHEILSKGCPKVYAIEISDVFRKGLEAQPVCAEAVKAGRLTISGDDAKSLAFIPSKSVDRILGINVVYFLDPMADYFKELHRILKPGGMLLWTVKDMVKSMDQKVYVNTDWDLVLASLKAAGFEASIGEARAGDGKKSGYFPLIAKKK
tara:strand:- start:1826 stop:2440 length:615 start_codon:yes stop_codon:yes gene_type:complete